MARPRRLVDVLAVVTVCATVLTVPGAAWATAGAAATSVLTVDGVFGRAVVDGTTGGTTGDTTGGTTGGNTAKTSEASVRVGRVLIPVPDQAAIPSGAPVRLSIRAPEGVTERKAVEALAPRPGPRDADATEITVTSVRPALPVRERSAVPGATVTGQHSLTVLPVYWGSGTDGATGASLTSLAENVRDYWREQSGDRIDIASITVQGWHSIDAPQGCDPMAIYNAAVAADELPGASGNDHYLIYFPESSLCSWAGWGYVNGPVILDNGNWSPEQQITDIAAHEFGHNLGLGHANTTTCTARDLRRPMAAFAGDSCTVKEYYDFTDVMGGATPMRTGNLNVAMADFLGLADVTTVSPGTSATVTLRPISDFDRTRGVRIPLADGTSLYVELRPDAGRDTRVTGWAGVQVRHRVPQNLGVTTQLLDMQPASATAFDHANLPVGTGYQIPNENAVVKVLSASDTSAVISVVPATDTADGSQRIKTPNGTCIGLASSDITSGTVVDAYSCNGSATQLWTPFPGDDTIRNSGLCLDATTGGTSDWTSLQARTCNDSESQKWRYTDVRELVSQRSGACVDMRSGPIRLQIGPCSGPAGQKWVIG